MPKFQAPVIAAPEDVIFSYTRAVTLNKSPAFILNVLGCSRTTSASQLKKLTIIPDAALDRRRQPGGDANILSTPIASIVDEKQVAPNAKNNDFGNDWLKMHSAGGRATIKCASTSRIRPLCWANASSPPARRDRNIIIKSVPDPASRRLLISRGCRRGHDLGADQIAALQDKPGVKVLSIRPPSKTPGVNTANTANPC